MASHSLYRKWRSQTFGDVVGQAHVTRTMRNALQMGRIAHAYLLCGPRGVGKTSVARILAKAINCEKPNDGEPCNECPTCVAITEGRALDVIEIDAASNRRIEEMRDLREKVKFAPSDARFKVYILDEAHMLTSEASNALLKTLEEPPARTVFMLVTTEAHKIPDTIISRCQRFNFRRISSREIVGQLAAVCQGEGLSVASDALALIARAATGSMRDAEGLLDQLVAYCGSEIGLEQARDVLGLTGDEPVRDLAELVISGDVSGGLQIVNGLAESGIDLRRFAETFVGYLRGVLLLKSGADAAPLTADVSADTVAAMRAVAQRVTMEQLVKLIRIFAEAELSPRGEVIPQLGLELAVVEAILHLERGQRSDESVSRRAPTAERPVRQAAVPQGAARGPVARNEENIPPLREAKGKAREDLASEDRHLGSARNGDVREEVPDPGRNDTAAPKAEDRPPAEPASLEAAFAQLRQRWGEVVEAVGPVNKPLQALLRSCGPHEIKNGQAIIGCDFPFHRERLNEVQNRVLLEKMVMDIVGTALPLRIEIVGPEKRGQAPSPATDPLVKEVLSWGGRIKAVVPGSDIIPATQSTNQPAKTGQEVNDEP